MVLEQRRTRNAEFVLLTSNANLYAHQIQIYNENNSIKEPR